MCSVLNVCVPLRMPAYLCVLACACVRVCILCTASWSTPTKCYPPPTKNGDNNAPKIGFLAASPLICFSPDPPHHLYHLALPMHGKIAEAFEKQQDCFSFHWEWHNNIRPSLKRMLFYLSIYLLLSVYCPTHNYIVLYTPILPLPYIYYHYPFAPTYGFPLSYSHAQLHVIYLIFVNEYFQHLYTITLQFKNRDLERHYYSFTNEEAVPYLALGIILAALLFLVYIPLDMSYPL